MYDRTVRSYEFIIWLGNCNCFVLLTASIYPRKSEPPPSSPNSTPEPELLLSQKFNFVFNFVCTFFFTKYILKRQLNSLLIILKTTVEVITRMIMSQYSKILYFQKKLNNFSIFADFCWFLLYYHNSLTINAVKLIKSIILSWYINNW